MNDHPATLKYANAFARSTGLELDDLLQEARAAVRRCEIAVEEGRYDPAKASFNTYTTNAVYKAMLTTAAKAKGVVLAGQASGHVADRVVEGYLIDGSCEDWVDESTPAPDRGLLIAELIRELPDDARRVVELVLGDGIPNDLVDAVLQGTRSARNRLRSYIRGALRLRRGDRAEAAFDAIGAMLSEI